MGRGLCSSKNVLLAVMILFTFCLGLSSILAHLGDVAQAMSNEEREELKEEARDMFYHAYRAYMENAYPADELMPLSCIGRWRGTEPSRGDIDDSLGNYSLTLVDSMDTLVILGDLEEFEHAVKLVSRDVSFDNDVIVSVFETNIRILGGLLSSHILAEYLQQRAGIMEWYRGDLLNLARDLGYRLLPAFNTTTGIPHARINLRYGLKTPKLESSRETCTACAGTMILEMAALSRLTGEPIFEEKAHRAMDELWKMRHRSSDLMGTVLNIHSGDWVRRDSGVGAGIDSYYEYCLKAYILLGDERYLGRFNKHYSAVMKYISQGPMLLDVHMHRPHTNSRNFMDALLAFWPGLQVLKGDIKPAVETHEMLYQVMQRHNFIPEAFTTDFQVHWGQHPLRPEFLESTYFLYRATNDPYYLEVGRNVLRSLQKYARVPCGYAAVKDVRTGIHEDRMDSFVLAETFKYLYLLFADSSDLVLDLDEFLFTTEAHLLPLSLARNSNYTVVTILEPHEVKVEEDFEFARSCPNTLHLFPESVRRPLRNMVDGVCPRRSSRRKLHAPDFQAGNPDHMRMVKDMGITIQTLADGRVQLLHTFSNAKSAADAEEGLMFMQEMVELSRSQTQQPDALPQAVYFKTVSETGVEHTVIINAGPAHFGQELRGSTKVTGRLAVADPLRACQELVNPERLAGRIVIMERGDCMFVDKARRIEKAGAIAGIVVDNTFGTSSTTSPMFAMSGDGTSDVTIPVVFLFYQDGSQLLQAAGQNPALIVTLADMNSIRKGKDTEITKQTFNILDEKRTTETTLERLKDSLQEILNRQDVMSKRTVVGKAEVTQMDVGDFRATVEHDRRGVEMIRISRNKERGGGGGGGGGSGKSSSSSSVTPVPPPTQTLNVVDDRWLKLRELVLSRLMQGSGEGEVVVPAPILRLYHQFLNKQQSEDGQDPSVSLTQLQAWLLAELSELGSGKVGRDTQADVDQRETLASSDKEQSPGKDAKTASDKTGDQKLSTINNKRTDSDVKERTEGEEIVDGFIKNLSDDKKQNKVIVKKHDEL